MPKPNRKWNNNGKDLNYSQTEILIIENNLAKTNIEIQTELANHGFKRSIPSIEVKKSKLKLRKIKNKA